MSAKKAKRAQPVNEPDDGQEEQQFHSRGLEKQAGNALLGLRRLVAGQPTAWELAPAPAMTGYLEGVRGTPNHRLTLRAWRYGWALLAGTKEDQLAARTWLVDFFAKQRTTEGHMMGEMLTTTHAQIWLHGVLFLCYVARHFKDDVLLALTGQWLRQHFYLLDLLAVDGVPHSPGSRSWEDTVPVRTAFYAVVLGKPAPGKVGIQMRRQQWWDDPFNAGVEIAQDLIGQDDTLGGITRDEREPALLRDPLYVYTSGSKRVVVFPHITKSDGNFIFWIAFDGETWSQSPPHPGGKNIDNPFPPPELAGASLTIVRGVNHAE